MDYYHYSHTILNQDDDENDEGGEMLGEEEWKDDDSPETEGDGTKESDGM